jgi:hypothetical protein
MAGSCISQNTGDFCPQDQRANYGSFLRLIEIFSVTTLLECLLADVRDGVRKRHVELIYVRLYSKNNGSVVS